MLVHCILESWSGHQGCPGGRGGNAFVETMTMDRDVKELIGVLMRVLGGGETSQAELEDLAFDADGELEAVLNNAYIKLIEFVHDRDLRLNDQDADRRLRSCLQECLDDIVTACDRQARAELN